MSTPLGPLVLLAIGQEALRWRVAQWLKREADVAVASVAEDACAWLRGHEAPAAVLLDMAMAPRTIGTRSHANPGVAAAADVYHSAQCVGGDPVVIALLPERPGEAQERFLQTRARLFDERCAGDAVLQLRREWRVRRHVIGAVAAIVLRDSNAARLTPPESEALAVVARCPGLMDGSELLQISVGAYKHRLSGVSRKMGAPPTVLGQRIRTEALAPR